jgi:hypothetical protein
MPRSKPRSDRRDAGERGGALLLCIVLVLASTTLAAVDLPGTQPSDGSGDPAFPPFQDGSKPGVLDSPDNCGCHENYRDAGEQIYEPYDSWAGSMMAHAARDPLFWASVDIANQDDRDRLGDIGVGDLCIRCHVPKGWYEGRSDCETAWGEDFDGSCLDGDLDKSGNDFEGVQCHFCHRMYDASQPPAGEFSDPAAPYDENAEIYLTTTPKIMRGPYSDSQPPGRHDFAFSELHRKSAFCGQCHNVTNPALNRRDPATGADLGYAMPVERTYREWEQSEYGRPDSADFAECQSCHMPPPDHDSDGTIDDGFACGNPPGPRGENTALEGPIWTHFFRGGGTFMLEVLKGEYGAALGRTEAFDAAIEQSRRLLEQETALLDLAVPDSVQPGASLAADVRVTNRTGHKLPTGYPEGRRLWIRTRSGPDVDGDGVLQDGEVTYESGAYDASTGKLTEDADLKLYQIEVGIWNELGTGECDILDGAGNKMFHFVLNDCIKSDNRIPPKGFTPDDETEVVAYTYPENPDLPGTLAHWDDTSYDIPVPADASAPILVDVAVLYQTTSDKFVDFLQRENRSTCDPFDSGCDPTVADTRPNRGEKMYDLWMAYGRSAPVEIARAIQQVPLDTGATGAPGEASNPTSAGAPLLVSGYDPATGNLTVTYEPACDAHDHTIYWGPLDQVGSYAWSGAECYVGATGTATFAPGAGAFFFVIVGNDHAVEGSYGLDSAGLQRPEDSGTSGCDLPRDLAVTCE